MSCSVCLLPFVTGPISVAPKFPPRGALAKGHIGFYKSVIGMCYTLLGCVEKMEWNENNLLGVRENYPMVFTQVWEIDRSRPADERGCLLVMHSTCANMLRKAFGCEDASDPEQLIELAEIEHILGRPSNSSDEGIGRLPHVRYETASGIDMRMFWEENSQPGEVCFNWLGVRESKLAWVLSRPDMFPKFHDEVSEKRLSSIVEPIETRDILTTLPADLLFKLLPYLDIPTYVSLAFTCRTLRKLALVEFQPHARKLVLSIPWSTPLLHAYDKSEHQPNTPGMVHPEASPPTGDWFLYLSHIHRTDSMRERRRIWNICEEIKYQYDLQKPVCAYMKDIKKQKQVQDHCRSNIPLAFMMKKAGKGKGDMSEILKNLKKKHSRIIDSKRG